MKVLLINPGHQDVYNKVPTIAGLSQPMGLACLAAYIRANGYSDVKILDAEAERISLNDLKNYIPNDVDIVGCGSLTPNLKNATEILKIAKSVNPNCVTILGGDHITALPEETMKEFPIIDIGCIGEGEITLLELCKELEKKKPDFKKIKGVIFRVKEKLVKTEARPLIKDLDSLPIPAYDLLPMEKYSPPAHHTGFGKGVKLKPFTIFFSLRGCPYNCRYCASKVMWQKKVRYRSVAKVVEEIDYLIKNYGIKCLEFNDENFIINKPRMYELLKELKKRHEENGLYWNCLTRVDSVDEESITAMKEAGCYFIRFGVESGSQKLLDAMDKGITVQQVRDAFKLVNRLKMPASASFIIGYPGETKETFEETLKLVKEIKPTLAFFFVAIPIVGTDLFKIAKEKNLIQNPDWAGWVQMAEVPIMRTEELTSEQLLAMRKKAYNTFYLRPAYILHMIGTLRNKEQLKYYTRGFLGLFSIVKD